MPEATTTLDRDQTIARLASTLRALYTLDRPLFDQEFGLLPQAVAINLPGQTVLTAPDIPLLKLASAVTA